jgi:hypothetical protein
MGVSTAQAVVTRAAGYVQGKSNSTFIWAAPAAKSYKVWVYINANGTAAKARYRIYPKGMAATTKPTDVCSSTDVTYPCYQVFINQSLNKNKWVQLKTSTLTSWNFTTAGRVTAWSGNLVNTVNLSVAGVNFQDSVTLKSATVRATGVVQGASKSMLTWTTPLAKTYKVFVYTGNGTATKARYRVYPKGKPATATATTACSSTATYPCYQILVNQALNKNKWIQLKTAAGVSTKWAFTTAGVVEIWTGNLVNTEWAAVAGLDFQIPLVIGQAYQGGIIFRLDATQQHGLIAAATNQSTGLIWDYNNPFTVTNVTDTGIAAGKLNTSSIVSKLGAGGSYAARLCDSLVLNSYSDWYLPSKDQLALMYQNISKNADGTLKNNFKGDNYYWSSSENGDGGAWAQFFGPNPIYTLRQVTLSKNTLLYVRAIRTF